MRPDGGGKRSAEEGGGPAWAPDVLIEFLEESDEGSGDREVIYAVVVDAKYSKNIQDHHWSRVMKYSEIRSVATSRQVVRQVWLAHPGDTEGIRCRDAAVTWTPYGPDRPRDENVFGTLSLCPRIDADGEADDEDAAESREPNAARQFALGLLAYTRFLAPAEVDGATRAEVAAASTTETGAAEAR